MMKTSEFSGDYTWTTITVDDDGLQRCKGCGRRDASNHCDMLDTARSDDDIACAHWIAETEK